jgi:hypothetical protein
MSHTHWPVDLIERLFKPPYPEASTCPFKTKGECDTNFIQWSHGHTGKPCVKDYQPSKSKRGQQNKTKTCIL